MSDLIQKEIEKQKNKAKELSYEKKLDEVKATANLAADNDYETEKLLYTESSMDKVLDNDIEALANYSQIKAKQRMLDGAESEGTHTNEYRQGKSAIHTISEKETHRSMSKRRNKMNESAKRLSAVGKEARKLKGEISNMPMKQRIKTLEGLYNNVREADRYFAEAAAGNSADETKLKEKAEINYLQNLYNMYSREEQNSQDDNEKDALRQRKEKLFEKLEQKKESFYEKYNAENATVLRMKTEREVAHSEKTKEEDKQKVKEKEQEIEEKLSVLSGQKELKTEEEMRKASEIKVLACVEGLRDILSTMNDKKYGTSDDKGTWFIIRRAGEAFLNNVEEKSDQERGADLAELLKSAQRYLGTHQGKRSTKKGRNRVDFATSVVNAVSEILKNSTKEGRVVAVDAILKKQDEISGTGDAEAKELNKKFFADYAKAAMQEDPGKFPGQEELISEKTFMLMHYKEKVNCYGEAAKKISGGLLEKTIYQRSVSINAMGKSFMLTRKGDVRPEDANDAMLAKLAMNRAYNADVRDVPYLGRSAFIKALSQIKITPDMLTREYLDTHVFEMQNVLQCILTLQNYYTDWTDEKRKKAGEKEYNAIPKKITMNNPLTNISTHLKEYYMRTGFLNGYTIERGFSDRMIKDVVEIKQSIVPQELEEKSSHEEKRDYLNELAPSYNILEDMYEYIDVGGGVHEVVDGPEASLIKARKEFEENKASIEISEEEIKNIRYIEYIEEAKKESERQKINITPEAIALSKMQKLVKTNSDNEFNTPEGQAVSQACKERGVDPLRAYFQKIRFVNYIDGKPATEEDEKNLAYNKAYAKSIIEDNQEERVRLLKENCAYVADLINQVDFDRILDFDYWLHNKDLYVTLSNFELNGMETNPNSLIKADAEIMDSFFKEQNPMMTLLNDFFGAFRMMHTIVGGPLGMALGVDEQGVYLKDKMSHYNVSDPGACKDMIAEMEKLFMGAKNSNAAYIASKNK